MAASFRLTWYRPPYWAEKLGKPPGYTESPYPSLDYDEVKKVAEHINSLDPIIQADVKVLTS